MPAVREAIARSRETARNKRADLRIQGRDAQFPKGRSLGNNPFPTEGQKTHKDKLHAVEGGAIVTPPASANSASQTLEIALSNQLLAFKECKVENTAAARLRNDAARDASANIRTLEARMQALTPADPVIDLLAGVEALKLFVAGLDDDVSSVAEIPDLTVITKTMNDAEDRQATAEGLQESAVEALRQVEAEDAPLAISVAGAESDLSNLIANVKAIELHPEFETLIDDLAKARERAAEISFKLEEATSNATAYDQTSIAKKIEVIDARGRTAAETRNKLVTDVARLENTVEIEGGSGLADRAAAAQDEMDAAETALRRIILEADTIKLLRDTLDEARNDTAAKFVGPVAKRAKRHIERLLPDCELTFSDELALITVARSGVPETCGNLSKGTQEQLAVLTRIAFADILLEQGKPVSLILDDPLVYSDDSRLDLMIEILTEAATRMQVILLTCRDRAFRHVAGNRITIASNVS